MAPQDMGDANEHFKKQYEQAEKYSDDYLKAFSRGKAIATTNAIRLRTDIQDAIRKRCERMEKAIDEVLAQAGMDGPILQHPLRYRPSQLCPHEQWGRPSSWIYWRHKSTHQG
jgi:hypothetical protein